MSATVKMPFLGNNQIRRLARYFTWVGNILTKAFPYTDLMLKQSGLAVKYNVNGRGFMAI